MRNLLLIENDGNKHPLGSALSHADYRIRKIQDHYSLTVHVKEFSPDLVIFNLSVITEAFINELNALNTRLSLPVMVFTDECNSAQIKKLIQAEVSVLKVNGLPRSGVDGLIEIAIARFRHIEALKNALENARTQLEDRKQIDRAKAILIKTRNYSEDEAYHTLRKLAMGRNVTLGEMARNVIAMADLLK